MWPVEEMGSREPDSTDFLVQTESGTDIRRPLFQKLAEADIPILMLRPMDVELEDIFLELTRDREEEA